MEWLADATLVAEDCWVATRVALATASSRTKKNKTAAGESVVAYAGVGGGCGSADGRLGGQVGSQSNSNWPWL